MYTFVQHTIIKYTKVKFLNAVEVKKTKKEVLNV